MAFLSRQPWDAWCPTAIFDHSKSAKELARAGVDIYASKGTIEEIGLAGHHRANAVSHGSSLAINGGWTILPVELVHDCAEPMGFFIMGGGQSAIFITDTAYCKYVLPQANLILIEANYSEAILAANVEAGHIDQSRAKRVRENHMSIERVIDFCKAQDMSRCRAIHLLHGSDSSSDSQMFKKIVQETTGIPTYVEG